MNKRTVLLSTIIIIIGLVTLYLGFTIKSPRPTKDPNAWDLLIFTQTWPTALCYVWKSENANHTCNLPSQKNLWTIHGIWPTKLGTIGPGFCNKSIVFNPDLIYSIKKELDDYWTDIEGLPINVTEENALNSTTSHKKESIWAHEWEKHGSCAVSLPSLNSEYKFFFQGIEWSKKYNIKDILEKGGIQVNSSLNVSDYWKAVKLTTKTNVWIECTIKHDTKEQMLVEIRVCFDKNLNLVDCDGIKITRKGNKYSHVLTNCDINKPILYLDYVPVQNASFGPNSTVDDHSKVLLRSRRKVVDHPNEWTIKSSRHLNRSNSYQPRTNTTFIKSLNRSNSYPYIERKEWDVLIFSQSWPYTFCHSWTVNSDTHVCNLPANRNQWTIHGVWPSKIGSNGPAYCNNQTSFKLNALESIVPELHNRWTEIKGSKEWTKKREGDFWKYEWNKHGTCALSLPSLNSELKYFKQALDWSKQYSLTDLLAKGSIFPNNSYPVTQFWYTLKTGLGKKPFIDCYIDKSSNKAYIDEVRLCFNKTLSLVDCDHFKRNSDKPLTNCPLNQDISYIGASV